MKLQIVHKTTTNQIIFEKTEVFKNDVGQWVLHFTMSNYKYVGLNWFNGDKDFVVRIFESESDNILAEISLTPEEDEECDLHNAECAVFTQKWGYYLTFVPFFHLIKPDSRFPIHSQILTQIK